RLTASDLATARQVAGWRQDCTEGREPRGTTALDAIYSGRNRCGTTPLAPSCTTISWRHATPRGRPPRQPRSRSHRGLPSAQRAERVDDRGLCRLLRCDRLDLPALNLDQHRVERGVVVEVV